MATHSSILAWRIPLDRGAWWATAHRNARTEWVSKHTHSISQGGVMTLSSFHMDLETGSSPLSSSLVSSTFHSCISPHCTSPPLMQPCKYPVDDQKFCILRVMTKKILSCLFSSVTQSCPTLCDPMDCSTPGLPVHHQLPEFIQTHLHWVGDTIQPSHSL